MDALRQAIRQMIRVSDNELTQLLQAATVKTVRRGEALSKPGSIPNDVFFIEEGIVGVLITDQEGNEYTVHFALENQFIADYTNFILERPSVYTLQAISEVRLVVLPRASIQWGYEHLRQGDRLGRLIAEYYFIYQDIRVQNLYARTPKERYDAISQTFPNIHNRVSQKMIASYLGITPVHLSRLKKADRPKM